MRRILLLVLMFLSSTVAVAKDVTVDEATSAATFTAVGKPGFLKINGAGATVTGGCRAGVCIFTSDLTKITTGIALRDEHTKEKYLEVSKYPTAKLQVKQLGASGDTTGRLTLHGVTKDVPVHVVLTPQSGGVSVVAEMQLKLTDFKLDIPTYMGVTVAEDVTARASFIVK